MNKGITKIELLLGAVIVGLVVGFWLHAPSTIVRELGATNSPVGTTNDTARRASVVFIPSTGSATSTSILNSGSVDRIVTDVTYDCNTVGTSQTAYSGAGLNSLVFQAATTSSSAPNSLGNTNFILNTQVSTSTSDLYVASTTPGLVSTVTNRVWPTGSYLTFTSNATNTAVCVLTAGYLPF